MHLQLPRLHVEGSRLRGETAWLLWLCLLAMALLASTFVSTVR